MGYEIAYGGSYPEDFSKYGRGVLALLTIGVLNRESELMSRMVKRIDGAQNNLPSYCAAGHFEAAPCVILDEHIRIPKMLIMSTVAMDRITEINEDYAKIIRQCAEVDQGVNSDSGSALTESGHKAIFAFYLYRNGFPGIIQASILRRKHLHE